ncbi:DUF3817 domain-containing protein [Dactylosporangium aurantiacum]|uniref:DUF3817 domain-containing protein n=1 Tax=Dactylosporangium aurantiacum TaxID=35754 RepID=A0A9Q9IKB2_9ACTN|nr:DUF3817 domain-containing protein [Dactylosporangium aurantiacum]MDG6109780.1 DUF3817 domain-containing protein [Dactylosporangium aurantiacum]UWZ57186.1 DUF3817 domain-containing protein [Dactylosporangium aurantiacum]
MNNTAARVFRLAAIGEACSWLGLLVGMFFKYVVVENEIGVKIFGPVHGAMFVAYLAALVWVAGKERWGLGRIALGAVASIPPFTTLLFELWVERVRRAPAVEHA